MVIGKKYELFLIFVDINGYIINIIEEFKLLGVIIDKELRYFGLYLLLKFGYSDR